MELADLLLAVLQIGALVVSVALVIDFFSLCSRVRRIEDLLSLANQKSAFQAGVLERWARALEALACKSLAASPPTDQVSPAPERELSLGGYNR
jgi:hypothetical protein